MKRRESPEPFKVTRQEIDRVSRSVVAGAVLLLALGAGVLGFLCWAVWRFVAHFTGAA